MITEKSLKRNNNIRLDDKEDCMKWAPAPRYLCRKWATLQLLKNGPVGKILEIGFATGDFLSILAQRGYTGKGLELSDEAVRIAQERLKGIISEIKVEKGDFYRLDEKFDFIFAFEVLEHIEDDNKALEKWNELLNEDGALIFSVPAHRKMWGATDEHGGHLRRYEKQELFNKLERANFKIDVIWSYGFPLINILKPIRDSYYSKKVKANLDKNTRSAQSGISREIEYKFRFFMNDFFFYPFYLLQSLFFNCDLGTGYLIKAHKK